MNRQEASVGGLLMAIERIDIRLDKIEKQIALIGIEAVKMEGERNALIKTREKLWDKLERAEKALAACEDALEFYSKRGNYCMAKGTLLRPIQDEDDSGNKARHALAKIKEIKGEK